MKLRQMIKCGMSKGYRCITSKTFKPFFKKVDLLLEHILGSWYYMHLEKVKKRLKYGHMANYRAPKSKKESVENLLWKSETPQVGAKKFLVSVIVPSYNHGIYLRERLESVYGQSYDNIEVILLDDGSSDGSREILDEYRKKYPGKTRTVYNKTCCGNVYTQWNRGISMARGELIWIAESDDYCEKNFLEKVVPSFEYESVRIAFSKCVFIQDGRQTGSTEEYLQDLECFDWSRSFRITAHEAVKNGFVRHNLIANVSSAVFRRPGEIPEETDAICRSMRLSSDWIFYLSLIRGGSLSYVSDTVSYYRIHEDSTSLQVQKTEDYYREFAQVSSYAARHYRLDEESFFLIQEFLKEHYRNLQGKSGDREVEAIYSPEILSQEKKNRKLNIIMCVYSFQPGGGETFPLHLANALWEEGHAVSVLDFHQEPRNPLVHGLLKEDIPVISLSTMDNMYWVIEQLGGDIIHTHHAFTDEAVGCWVQNHNFSCRQIVTLHGFYELMEEEAAGRVLQVVGNAADTFCYVADKNLIPFEKNGIYREDGSTGKRFVKIPNGLAVPEVHAVRREDLGIGRDDFVLVVASRGLPQKGWKEAIQAVKLANKKASRRIRLVILGDGEMRTVLEPDAEEEIHFMGVVGNVRDYYAMADAGLVPTTFKGESYPLVIIECLQSGKPVIATDIAEIRNELEDGEGGLAGELLQLRAGKVCPEDISMAILRMAENEEYYGELVRRCPKACCKFDMKNVCSRYISVYRAAIERNSRKEENGC